MKEQGPEKLYFIRAVGGPGLSERILVAPDQKQAQIQKNYLLEKLRNDYPDRNDLSPELLEIWIAKRWKSSIWQRFRKKLSFFK